MLHTVLIYIFIRKTSTQPQNRPKAATVARGGGGTGKGARKATPSADNKDLMNMLKNLRQNQVESNPTNQSNKNAIALHTAQVIASNESHPRQKDVRRHLYLRLYLTGFILFHSSSLLSSTT